ncbi:MAG: hypothetical protein QF464_16250 [Myxococcota bacterium]|jgi:hypothetical protein|nr:hypothetical protein [Myxococcota bacterium]
MPLVNALPPSGLAEAYGRVAPAAATDGGNAAPDGDSAANTAPAGAGPAAVVQISEAARDLSAGLGKPGLNNGTMAAEGGDVADLRGLLSQRYSADTARLTDPAR